MQLLPWSRPVPESCWMRTIIVLQNPRKVAYFHVFAAVHVGLEKVASKQCVFKKNKVYTNFGSVALKQCILKTSAKFNKNNVMWCVGLFVVCQKLQEEKTFTNDITCAVVEEMEDQTWKISAPSKKKKRISGIFLKILITADSAGTIESAYIHRQLHREFQTCISSNSW